MNQEQISKNVRSLTERRAEIYALESVEKNNALLKSGKHETGDVGDTDSGSELADQDIALLLTKMEAAELARIDAALDRAKNGRYGVCEMCGIQIDAKRLAASPEASCCVGCQSVAEQH